MTEEYCKCLYHFRKHVEYVGIVQDSGKHTFPLPQQRPNYLSENHFTRTVHSYLRGLIGRFFFLLGEIF